MAEEVLTERRGGVGIIFLNRPKALNAWTGRMQMLCFDALKAMEDDDRVRVIVLTGNGRAFCAGADLSLLRSAATKQAKPQGPGITEGNRDVLYPTTILKPVIAAINGAVAGIGLSLVLACDIRFASPDAKLLGAFSRRGLVAEYGTSWTLPKLIGTGNAMMMLLSSDSMSGKEAQQLGIVQRCYPHDDLLNQTVSFAQHLADNCSPTSMAAMKLQIWNHHHTSLTHAVNDAAELMKLSISGHNADFKEGVLSFMQKRPAAFTPLDKKNPVVVRAIQKFLPKSRI